MENKIAETELNERDRCYKTFISLNMKSNSQHYTIKEAFSKIYKYKCWIYGEHKYMKMKLCKIVWFIIFTICRLDLTKEMEYEVFFAH